MHHPLADARAVLEAVVEGREPDPVALGRALEGAAAQDAEIVCEIHAAELAGEADRAAAFRAIRVARDAGLPPEGILVAAFAAVAGVLGWSELEFLRWGAEHFIRELGHADDALFVAGCIEAEQTGIPELWPFGRPPSAPAPVPPAPRA